MAKKKQEPFRYGEEVEKLRRGGPARAYLLRGEEDYLRDSFLAELKKLCVEEGTEAFNYHRLQGPVLDLRALSEAVEAMPFMGERTLVEVRDFDINRAGGYDPDALKALVSDIPDWATVAFVFSPGYAPDGKLKAVKAIKAAGTELEFTSPAEDQMVPWVRRRLESMGKRIDSGTASYLLWVCGSRMNALIPELTKLAGAAEGEEITRRDIDRVAQRSPETTIFDLTDALGQKKFDRAAALLADLLADRDEPPQKQIIMVSEQFRRLYVARTARDFRLGDDYITDCVPELTGRAYPLKLAKEAARSFSRQRLARAVTLCADCEFAMRDGGPEPAALMKELLLKLAVDA